MRIERGKVVSFDLQPGRRVGTPYEVVQRLGAGTEGEVYQILETDTGIHRAAKLYFPHHNPTGRAAVWNARKLHNLSGCPIVLQYYHTQQIQIAREKVLVLISEFCDGIPVDQWTAQQRGGRLHPYVALHLLYRLVRGLEAVHARGEYHADVHTQNILVAPKGVDFSLKLLDFYNWGRRARYKQSQDIVDCINVFHECLGGPRHYSKQVDEIRHICAGLQRSRILKRFPTMSALRLHLESFDWARM
jgi:serine/threonine protein kinase